jgi:MFS family permease
MQPRYMGFLGGLVVALSMVAMVIGRESVLLLLAYNVTWGIGMGANITVNNVIWPDYFGRRFLGTIRGVVFPISVATSAISVPLYAGLLDVSPDPRYVWAVTLVAFVLAAVLLLIAKRPRLSDVHPGRDEIALATAEPGG